MKELAEVLAVDFQDVEEIPKLKPNWRWEDEEQALLTSCSSLITTIETGNSRIVQFSHFSVKEYLTSERLATLSGEVSRYHIDLEPAHTILAQACMGVLLQPDDGVEENGGGKRSPLAGYASRYWVTHAQFERVSSFLRRAMEILFDPDEPYFAAWLQLYDIDTLPSVGSSSLDLFSVYTKSGATPLYYAALCGFEDLVEHLVAKFPQHVDISGGHYVKPLFAALAGKHFRTAKLLHRDGTQVDVRGNGERTPIDSSAFYGDLEMVQLLLDYKADVNFRDRYGETPLHFSSRGSRFPVPHSNFPQLWPDVARLLLEHDADVNARTNDGETPLHSAGTVEVARVLLEHGANVGAVDNQGRTTLHTAAEYGNAEAARMLLEHGANIGAVDSQGRTPFHAAAERGAVEVVRVLLEHGANIGAVDNQGMTPLHLARMVKVVHVLLEHSANIGAVDNQGRTPFHAAAKDGTVEIVRLLLERGANIGAVDNQGRTSFHAAAKDGTVEIVRLLLERGANIGAVDNQGRTPFHAAAEGGTDERADVVRVLLEHGANVGAVDNDDSTPLHLAWEVKVVRMLLEHGADIGALDNQGRTPLHIAADFWSPYNRIGLVRVLLEHGANVSTEDNKGRTPFQIAKGAYGDSHEVMELLSEHSAKVV